MLGGEPSYMTLLVFSLLFVLFSEAVYMRVTGDAFFTETSLRCACV